MKKITTPISDDEIVSLKVGDQILISGTMYTGRDAILPKLAELANEKKSPVDLKGMAIMHTAVSDAGIAPTTSNKYEIESTIPFLSENGVKIHIGKGSLSEKTVDELNKNNSIFVVCPPTAALISNKVLKKRMCCF